MQKLTVHLKIKDNNILCISKTLFYTVFWREKISLKKFYSRNDVSLCMVSASKR